MEAKIKTILEKVSKKETLSPEEIKSFPWSTLELDGLKAVDWLSGKVIAMNRDSKVARYLDQEGNLKSKKFANLTKDQRDIVLEVSPETYSLLKAINTPAYLNYLSYDDRSNNITNEDKKIFISINNDSHTKSSLTVYKLNSASLEERDKLLVGLDGEYIPGRTEFEPLINSVLNTEVTNNNVGQDIEFIRARLFEHLAFFKYEPNTAIIGLCRQIVVGGINKRSTKFTAHHLEVLKDDTLQSMSVKMTKWHTDYNNADEGQKLVLKNNLIKSTFMISNMLIKGTFTRRTYLRLGINFIDENAMKASYLNLYSPIIDKFPVQIVFPGMEFYNAATELQVACYLIATLVFQYERMTSTDFKPESIISNLNRIGNIISISKGRDFVIRVRDIMQNAKTIEIGGRNILTNAINNVMDILGLRVMNSSMNRSKKIMTRDELNSNRR